MRYRKVAAISACLVLSGCSPKWEVVPVEPPLQSMRVSRTRGLTNVHAVLAPGEVLRSFTPSALLIDLGKGAEPDEVSDVLGAPSRRWESFEGPATSFAVEGGEIVCIHTKLAEGDFWRVDYRPERLMAEDLLPREVLEQIGGSEVPVLVDFRDPESRRGLLVRVRSDLVESVSYF